MFKNIKKEFQKYIVKPKDTLYSLSKFFSISIEELKEINLDLKKYPLLEGMVLYVPERVNNKNHNFSEKGNKILINNSS